jgi:hypothetical protein
MVFICLRQPPLLGFCVGLSSNFVGFESGQIQNVKKNAAAYGRQQDSTAPSPCHRDTGKGGGGRVEPERMLEE